MPAVAIFGYNSITRNREIYAPKQLGYGFDWRAYFVTVLLCVIEI